MTDPTRPPSRRPPRRDPRASWRVISVSGKALAQPTSYLMWRSVAGYQSYSPTRAQRRSRLALIDGGGS